MKVLRVLTASLLGQLPRFSGAERVTTEFEYTLSSQPTDECPYRDPISSREYFEYYQKKWRNKVGIARYYLGPGAYHTAVLFQNHLFTFGLPSDGDCKENPPDSGVQIEQLFPKWPNSKDEATEPRNDHFDFYKQAPVIYMIDMAIDKGLEEVERLAVSTLPYRRVLPCFNNCVDQCKYQVTTNNCNSFSSALLKSVTGSRCSTLPSGTTMFTGVLDALPEGVGHRLVGNAYSMWLARDASAKKECDMYRAEGDGCSWTQDYRCPTQPRGTSRRHAGNDGSVGYRCCCSECEAYMKEPDACGWTKDYSCPGQPKGRGVAGDTNSLGFLCCCLQERWRQ
mmetsp:Transcript_43869/g.126825  ORF Transcript_43869/g.126825 Transcript_43869/m.126825 type:complete len:338 (-) Transcript_43869:76-1089(-)